MERISADRDWRLFIVLDSLSCIKISTCFDLNIYMIMTITREIFKDPLNDININNYLLNSVSGI